MHFSGEICCLFFHQSHNCLISLGSGKMPVNNPQVHPQVLWIKNRRANARIFEFFGTKSPIQIGTKNGIPKIKQLSQYQPINLGTYPISTQSYPQGCRIECRALKRLTRTHTRNKSNQPQSKVLFISNKNIRL